MCVWISLYTYSGYQCYRHFVGTISNWNTWTIKTRWKRTTFWQPVAPHGIVNTHITQCESMKQNTSYVHISSVRVIKVVPISCSYIGIQLLRDLNIDIHYFPYELGNCLKLIRYYTQMFQWNFFQSPLTPIKIEWIITYFLSSALIRPFLSFTLFLSLRPSFLPLLSVT